MYTTRRLWIALALLLGSTFAVLLWVGSEIHRAAPPMPEQVVSADGHIFAIGALLISWFVLRLWIAPRRETLAREANVHA